MRRRITVLTALAAVVALAATVLAASVIWTRLHKPYKGFDAPEQFVQIPPGAGAADIARTLRGAGVIEDEQTFRLALWWRQAGRTLKAGEYRFDRPASALDVVDRLARGDVHARRITFPEGLTIAEMAALYEARGFGPARAFIAAAADASLIRDLDPEAEDLEGYLFPETYSLPRGMPASRLVHAMVQRFRATYLRDLHRLASARALTTREVVTLASLVEKETARPEERPLVSAVYHNRLKRGMSMQADPTLVYALRKAGRWDGNIRRADLAFDSPYNTYRHPGLPPGPIASPGKASLEAAVAPADVKHLYFVSRNDGSHVFADTLAQHNANVYEHQILYFRRLRQQQRAQPAAAR